MPVQTRRPLTLPHASEGGLETPSAEGAPDDLLLPTVDNNTSDDNAADTAIRKDVRGMNHYELAAYLESQGFDAAVMHEVIQQGIDGDTLYRLRSFRVTWRLSPLSSRSAAVLLLPNCSQLP